MNTKKLTEAEQALLKKYCKDYWKKSVKEVWEEARKEIPGLTFNQVQYAVEKYLRF